MRRDRELEARLERQLLEAHARAFPMSLCDCLAPVRSLVDARRCYLCLRTIPEASA